MDHRVCWNANDRQLRPWYFVVIVFKVFNHQCLCQGAPHNLVPVFTFSNLHKESIVLLLSAYFCIYQEDVLWTSSHAWRFGRGWLRLCSANNCSLLAEKESFLPVNGFRALEHETCQAAQGDLFLTDQYGQLNDSLWARPTTTFTYLQPQSQALRKLFVAWNTHCL